MAYSMEPVSDGCYPGTAVLVNKFDIRDDAKLKEVESILVSARNAEWLNSPLQAAFDFEHYKAIHRFLFSDLYDWAGQVRTVDISKKGTQFCPADQIEERAALIFARLKSLNYFTDLGNDEFAEEIVDFYCVTNDLHPFREGNGRTQRIFLSQLIENAGYGIDWAEIDGDLLMIATIQAAQGVTDLLRQIFHTYIRLKSGG